MQGAFVEGILLEERTGQCVDPDLMTDPVDAGDLDAPGQLSGSTRHATQHAEVDDRERSRAGGRGPRFRDCGDRTFASSRRIDARRARNIGDRDPGTRDGNDTRGIELDDQLTAQHWNTVSHLLDPNRGATKLVGRGGDNMHPIALRHAEQPAMMREKIASPIFGRSRRVVDDEPAAEVGADEMGQPGDARELDVQLVARDRRPIIEQTAWG